jgi:hypothetical protein
MSFWAFSNAQNDAGRPSGFSLFNFYIYIYIYIYIKKRLLTAFPKPYNR